MNRLGPSSSWSKAFTIIELLVVIAIIAILVAMLMPSIQKVKERSKSAACASNLRQLGTVFQLYGADHNYWLPHMGIAQHGYPHVGEWYMFYYPYLSDTLLASRYPNDIGRAVRVFDCPSTPADEKPFDYICGYAHSFSDGSYDGLCGKKLYQLRVNTILLIDHTAFYNDWVWQTAPQNPGGIFWNAYFAMTHVIYQPGWQHNNGANILFKDGRVEWHARIDYQPNYQINPFGIVWMPENLVGP